MPQEDIASENGIGPQKNKMSLWWIWLILGIIFLAGIAILTYFLLKKHYSTPTPGGTPSNPPSGTPSNPPSGTPTNPPPTPSNPPQPTPSNPPPQPTPSNPPPQPTPSNPPPPPEQPCPQYYSIANVNFNGNDIKGSGSPLTATSEEDCQAKCNANPGCLFYNYEPGSSKNNCWIKNPNIKSGYQLGFNIPNQPGYSCPNFMEFLGAEITDQPAGKPNTFVCPNPPCSVGQCQSACEGRGCHFYTFDASGLCSMYDFSPKPGTNTGVNLWYSSSSVPPGTPFG